MQVPEPLFNKVGGSPTSLLKKETLAQIFSCEFCEIFKNTYFRVLRKLAPILLQKLYLNFHLN